MRPSSRSSRPRHLAGAPREAWQPYETAADFDVSAALDADAEFDFEGLFLADDLEQDAPPTRAKVARHRIAFAVSVTLAALPLLVLDNLGAGADSSAEVESTHEAADLQGGTSEVPPVVVDVTVAKATVFVSQPSTSAAAEPTATAEPTAPAEPTTTTVKPTTTTAKPTTTTTVKPTTTTAKPTTTTVEESASAALVGPATVADPASVATWDQLAQCESSGRWNAVSAPRGASGTQYYGGLQFSLATWEHFGGTGLPSEASKDEQIAIGRKVQAKQGWGAWPSCAKRLGWT